MTRVPPYYSLEHRSCVGHEVLRKYFVSHYEFFAYLPDPFDKEPYYSVWAQPLGDSFFSFAEPVSETSETRET